MTTYYGWDIYVKGKDRRGNEHEWAGMIAAGKAQAAVKRMWDYYLRTPLVEYELTTKRSTERFQLVRLEAHQVNPVYRYRNGWQNWNLRDREGNPINLTEYLIDARYLNPGGPTNGRTPDEIVNHLLNRLGDEWDGARLCQGMFSYNNPRIIAQATRMVEYNDEMAEPVEGEVELARLAPFRFTLGNRPLIEPMQREMLNGDRVEWRVTVPVNAGEDEVNDIRLDAPETDGPDLPMP